MSLGETMPHNPMYQFWVAELMVVVFLGVQGCQREGNGGTAKEMPPVTKEDGSETVEWEESSEDEPNEFLIKTRKDSERISLYTANLFDERLQVRCESEGVRIAYVGPLGRSGDRQHILPNELHTYLMWQAVLSPIITVGEDGITVGGDGLVLFSFHISLDKTEDTVTSCRINDQLLYLDVFFIKEGKSLDDPLLQNGMTLRELLERLKGEEPEPGE